MVSVAYLAVGIALAFIGWYGWKWYVSQSEQMRHNLKTYAPVFALALLVTVGSLTVLEAQASAVSFSGLNIETDDAVGTGINFANLLMPLAMLVIGLAIGSFIVSRIASFFRGR